MSDKDVGTDLEEMEVLRKESAGKDRKISELLEENKRLKAQSGEDGEPEESGVANLLERMSELMGNLKAREELAAAREAAINKSIELGIPVSLGTRNATAWDEFEKEITELAEDVFRGKDFISSRIPQKRDFKGKVKKEYHKKTDGLTALHIGKMSRGELSRLPDYILDKFSRSTP